MFNATQMVGLIVTAVAATACLAAAPRRPWRALAVLHIVAFVEILFGFRHTAHTAANRILSTLGLYQQREVIQFGLLAVVLIIGLAFIVAVGRQPSRAARLGMLASGALILVFLTETVSLHAIDAVLYTRMGSPVALIALLWAVLCITTAVAARSDRIPGWQKGRKSR